MPNFRGESLRPLPPPGSSGSRTQTLAPSFSLLVGVPKVSKLLGHLGEFGEGSGLLNRAAPVAFPPLPSLPHSPGPLWRAGGVTCQQRDRGRELGRNKTGLGGNWVKTGPWDFSLTVASSCPRVTCLVDAFTWVPLRALKPGTCRI